MASALYQPAVIIFEFMLGVVLLGALLGASGVILMLLLRYAYRNIMALLGRH
jgi:hypothetical protein